MRRHFPFWKQCLLAAYYGSTLPCRWWRNHRAAVAGRAPVIILFYHRVADTVFNDWTCPTDTFVAQMDWLQQRFEMVSLAEAQRRIASGQNERPCVHISFDDGYADNCNVALPLLVEQEIPCTYFVATRFVLEQRPFPHDVAAGEPLAPNTPGQLREFAAAGIEIGAHTRTHADLGKISDTSALEDEIVGSRRDLEDLLGRQVDYFAFPFGTPKKMSLQAFQLVRDAGFRGACSAYGDYNWPGDESFHLRRFHGEPEMVRLKNCVTVDPRKIRQPRFDFPTHEPVLHEVTA
jgi:peptidoglycan/xylan/chitin deacetylase (PgdA/CDA1 family)